jgi:predicted DNA-binding WGR domain protein
MKQSFSSFRAVAGAESQFQKKQLQKKERTYSQAVRQIMPCREHIELAHDCAY